MTANGMSLVGFPGRGLGRDVFVAHPVACGQTDSQMPTRQTNHGLRTQGKLIIQGWRGDVMMQRASQANTDEAQCRCPLMPLVKYMTMRRRSGDGLQLGRSVFGGG